MWNIPQEAGNRPNDFREMFIINILEGFSGS